MRAAGRAHRVPCSRPTWNCSRSVACRVTYGHRCRHRPGGAPFRHPGIRCAQLSYQCGPAAGPGRGGAPAKIIDAKPARIVDAGQAERVDEAVKQQGRPGASSCGRRCSGILKSVSSGNCSSTVRNGPGSGASAPRTCPAWWRRTGPRWASPEHESGPGHQRDHLRPELSRQRANSAGAGPAGKVRVLPVSLHLGGGGRGAGAQVRMGRGTRFPGPQVPGERRHRYRTPTTPGSDRGRPCRQPGAGMRGGRSHSEGDIRELPPGQRAEGNLQGAER